MNEFSVLMSVYYREKAEYLRASIESILINQTIVPGEVVIVKDGYLGDDLHRVLEEYRNRFPNIVKLIQLEKNVGLGEALRIGITECRYNLIARMDSDDISNKVRFEKQLEVFRKMENIDLVGSNIAEFFDVKEKIEFIRKVPKSNIEIFKMMKMRNPINHVSVMFKKDKVIESGNYKHILYLEDYYLWIRMMINKCNFYNIQEELVFVRTGKDMFERRSNKIYIRGWFSLQKEMYKLGVTNRFNFILNMVNIIVFIYIPPTIKKFLYKYILRK